MNEKTLVSTVELEQQIFETEEIRVIIRANKEERFETYPYKRKSSTTTSITEWTEQRLKPLIKDRQATVIDGSGVQPHGRTNIETVRNSYQK